MKLRLACLWVAVLSASVAAAAPTIASASPNPVDAGYPFGFPLTINGTGFVNGSVVYWGSTVLSTDYVNSLVLTAHVRQDLRMIADTYFIQVVNPDGTASNLYPFTVSIILSAITPYATFAGEGAVNVTVKGIGFQSRFVIRLSLLGGPVTIVPTFVDSGTLTAVIPSGTLASAQTASVQIVDPQTGNTSSSLAFEIHSMPAIASASPSTFDAGGVGFPVVVSGSGFVPSSVVNWAGGGVLGTTYISATQLQAAITPELRSLAGAYKLTVSDPASGAVSNSYAVAVSPVLFTIGPGSTMVGSPAVTITATGAGFTSKTALAMMVAGQQSSLPTTYISENVLSGMIPAGALLASSSISIQVIDSAGGGRSLPQLFAVGSQPPQSIGAVTPAAVAVGSPSFTLTVNSGNFIAGATVLWNGSALTTTFVSATQLTAAVPAALVQQAGSASITVSNAGTVSAAMPLAIRSGPVISSASPNAVDAGGSTFILTVTGSNFPAGSVVNWPGGGALGTNFVSATQLQATVTADLRTLAGAFKVTVSDPATGAVSNSYPVVVAPVLFTISPATAMAGSSSLTITATGAGFTANTSLTAAQTAIQTTYVNATTLTGFLPATVLRSPASISIQVNDSAGGGHSLAQTLTVSPAAPGINSLVPNAVNAGASAFTLTVNGSNFTNGAVIQWNGTPLPTTFVAVTQLTAAVAASLVQVPGTASIAVTVAGAPTAAAAFTIDSPPPSLSSISPASTTAGAAAFTLTATGANCGAGCVVQWNGVPLSTTVVSATQITAVVPANLVALAGAAAVRLVNANAVASNTAPFVINPPAPTLTGTNPASITAGSSAVTFTVNGANFAPGAMVQWNGSPLATTFVGSSQLTATVPANLVSGLLSAVVTVSNPGSAVSNALTITINSPGPTITSLSPGSIAAGAGPFTLTVGGQSFAINCVVRWNGAPLYTTLVSATQATASVTADLIATPGSAAITLANPSGLESHAAAFTIVIPIPSISTLSPASAPPGAAEFTLTVSGTNFLASSKVLWNGTPLSTTVVSSTQMIADVPTVLLAAAGLASVAVTTPGVSALNAAVFTIGVPLPVSSTAGIVNAATALPAIAPGSLISVYGTNLASGNGAAQSLPLPAELNGTSVSINGVAAPLLYVSAGQINAQVPFEIQPGTATLLIQAGTLESAPVTFVVAAVAPGIWPAGLVPAAVGAYVTVYGTGQGVVDASEPFALPLAPVTAQVGDQKAQVSFAGMAPGMAGVLQVNLVVPPVNPGQQDLVITIGGTKSNAVPLWVQ